MYLQLKKLDFVPKIRDESLVKVKYCGNVTEILSSQHRSAGGYTRKLDKNTYIDTRTGEIKEFQHGKNRSSDLQSVARSLAQGRDLLNTNITDVSHCRWITLTYGENMTDPARLHRDFKLFNRACRKEFGHYEYITAAEPQARGAWHLHVVMIFPSKAPYMDNGKVRKLWGQGFVTVKKLDDVDNVGAYLTAYLGDMDLSEAPSELQKQAVSRGCVKEVEYIDEDGKKATKRYLKGARLHMYPTQFHIFRWSRGVKKPEVEVTTYKKAKEKASSAKLTYAKAVVIEDPERDFENTLIYEYYNSARNADCQ
jgi:hypothetical protein